MGGLGNTCATLIGHGFGPRVRTSCFEPKLKVIPAAIRFGAMDVTKPYRFIKFGAMEVTKPYKFIRFGAMDVTKPSKLIKFGAMDVTKPEQIYRVWGHGCHQTI